MNRIFTRLLVIGFFAPGIVIAAGLTQFQITFKTVDCNGETGFASVELERIYRVESANCSVPENPDLKLKNVFVRRVAGNSFDLFTVTPEQAESIEKQIEMYMRSKQKALEEGNAILIER